MKFLKIYSLLVLFSLLVFTQCTKDNDVGKSTIEEPIVLNEETLVDTYITQQNGLDKQDAKINNDILLRSIVLKEILTDSEIDHIIDLALEKESLTVELSEILEWKEVVTKNADKIRAVLNSYGLNDISVNYIQNLDTKMEYEEVEYDIMFHCYHCTEKKSSRYLSSGLEINKVDDILAWDLSSDDYVILNEGNPLLTENNVLIMDFQDEKSKMASNRPTEQDLKGIESKIVKRDVTKVFTGNTKDNMRFDWRGDEEFAMTLMGRRYADSDIDDYKYLRLDGGGGSKKQQRTLHSIDEDDLGTTFWGSYDIINTVDTDVPEILDMHIFFNLFERDWQYSNRWMGQTHMVGQTFRSIWGKTKYSTHWLLYNAYDDAYDQSIPKVIMADLDASWSLEFQSDRATINLHKDN